jgi:hypothetical protein
MRRLHLQGRKIRERKKCCGFFLPWRWRLDIPPKRRFSQDPYNSTSQKTAFFIVTAVKISNPESEMVHKFALCFHTTDMLHAYHCNVTSLSAMPGILQKIFEIFLGFFVRPPLWSSGQSSWLQIQRSGLDSRRYQIFWEVVSQERAPLSLVSTIEELLERKSSGSCLESREYSRRDPSRWPRGTLYPQTLALTSPKAAVARSV